MFVASSGGRIFSRHVAESEGSHWAVLDSSGTVVSQGFDWYMDQLETWTGSDEVWRKRRQRRKIARKRPKKIK